MNFIFPWFNRLRYDSLAGIFFESPGWHLSEAILVRPRKFAEVPEAPVQGDIGNGGGITLCLAQFIPGPMQPETVKVG